MSNKVLISYNKLSDQLKCPICNEIFTNTVCLLDCMHRFCKSCLNTSFQINNNQNNTKIKKCPVNNIYKKYTEYYIYINVCV